MYEQRDKVKEELKYQQQKKTSLVSKDFWSITDLPLAI